ncbi:hypothetical protein AYO44_08535 [Planctomycetaceae bacterium SCGC AG-212-F19]|nr:hypothetical protein AYO44_08535 [Planctomycetaceae bacterium SCGC AG-212-F19]
MAALDGDIVFKNAMDLWFAPEIERRQAEDRLPKPVEFLAGQVVFHADQRGNEIRINEEVRAIASVKLKVSKEAGQPIYAHEIDGWEDLRLPETEDPNCGHFTVLRLQEKWYIFFDFRYNKGHARELLDASKQFLSAAEHSLVQGNFRALVDNLFSASELAAHAVLVTTTMVDIDSSHGEVHSRFNQFARLGNVDASHRNTFNTLASMRTKARYVNGPFFISAETAEKHLAEIKELHCQAELRIGRIK